MTHPLSAHHGQVTTRTPGGIHKQAVRGDGEERYQARVAGIHREAMVLEHLEGRGIAPGLLDVGDAWSLQEDLGDSIIPDGETLRRACVRLLYDIRNSGMHHGDLTEANIILRGDRAYAVDWQDASWWADEQPLQASPKPDSYFLWRFIASTIGEGDTVPDVPRVARRWQAVVADLRGIFTDGLEGIRLFDLGCFQGDFVAAAAAEGMITAGVDHGGFRSGEDSIEIAQRLWAGMFHANFVHLNMVAEDVSLPRLCEDAEVAICFSTWPYLLQDCAYGGPGPLTRQEGMEWLRDIARAVDVLYFETQLAGDGPGPAWLRGDIDVLRMLEGQGLKPRPIGMFPVTGRPSKRTVWRVTA